MPLPSMDQGCVAAGAALISSRFPVGNKASLFSVLGRLEEKFPDERMPDEKISV